MTGTNRRSPTNKEFKTNFQGLASTKTKKGHLTSEKNADDNSIEVGTLVRISKKKLYENGWDVKIGSGSSAKTYHCSYSDGVLYIPDSTETNEYYVPKQKVEVELTIDKKTKIYTITKINTLNKKPIALYEDNLTISTDTNENTSKAVDAAIEISKKVINFKSNNVTITDSENNTIDLIESQNKIDKLEDENKAIKDKVSDLKNENKSLLGRIEILEQKINQNENEEGEGE